MHMPNRKSCTQFIVGFYSHYLEMRRIMIFWKVVGASNGAAIIHLQIIFQYDVYIIAVYTTCDDISFIWWNSINFLRSRRVLFALTFQTNSGDQLCNFVSFPFCALNYFEYRVNIQSKNEQPSHLFIYLHSVTNERLKFLTKELTAWP